MIFTTQIKDGQIECVLTTDRTLTSPVFCCSGMAPMAPCDDLVMLRRVGSYLEVQLPDLTADQAFTFHIEYTDGYVPRNRAWLPMGPYLRHAGEIISLPTGPLGRHPQTTSTPQPLAPEDCPVLPKPKAWAPTGESVKATGFASDDPALEAVAALANRQGMAWHGTLPITVEPADLPPDSYALHITPGGVTLHASDYGGRFYGGVTLLHLLQSGPLPCGILTDQPRFEWRGQHLDTARHYYDPSSITALLDLMALLKLNRFHWHFADDEAFRIEVDSRPELWQRSAMRGEGHLLPGLFTGAPEQGGTYSKDTVRAIIAHAQSLNIEIMPEVEVPAHALVLAEVYPDTRDPDDTGTERSVQGYARNIVNPAMPQMWEVVGDLIDEISDLFPFPHLHLGGDELPHGAWSGSPRAQALMAKEGLKTSDDLMAWTLSQLAANLQAKGIRPAAWEEAARGKDGGIGNDAILFSWTGAEPGLKAARAGYSIVMTPAQHLYFDMAHTADPDDWGAAWAAFVDLPDTIAWDPTPEPEFADKIIGVQGAFWSEFTTQDAQMWPMLMPRMLGLGALAWEDAPDINRITHFAASLTTNADGRITYT